MINKISKYWQNQINIIDWEIKPKKTFLKYKNNTPAWFPDGKLDVYHNTIGKYLNKKNKNKKIIFYVDKKKKIKKYSYLEIDLMVKNFENYLRNFKNLKRVMVHTSASVYSAVIMLGLAKNKVHFSVIFEDLEVEAIDNRIKLFKPDLFISSSSEKLNKILNNKIKKTTIDKIFIKKNKIFIPKKKTKNTNKNFFTLFTSGSTGEPKGITHGYNGYFFYSAYTCKKQFGINKNSFVLTASDAGWINGHTYALFGPLSLGAKTLLIENNMDLLDLKLFKKIIKLNITILYMPVTLIRLMRALYPLYSIKNHKIKTLGSMGEPLAKSVGDWFSKKFIKINQSIVNTYFQTETGGIIASPTFKDKNNLVPNGSVGKPVNKYIQLLKLDKNIKKELKITSPWPGCMISVINGKKVWDKYWDIKGNFRLFDLATLQKKNIYIHGRTDDVINIRGHRIGSEEIESIILKLKDIAEACAIAVDDELEGKKIILFIKAKSKMNKSVNKIIHKNFGIFALPKKIVYVRELPKTRSGKILRRLLRQISDKSLDLRDIDLTTMQNKNLIYEIIKEYEKN